jgi:hypothetical protein
LARTHSRSPLTHRTTKEKEMPIDSIRPPSSACPISTEMWLSRAWLAPGVLPFGRLWYGEPNAISNAIDYAKFYSRSHDAVIRVYDDAGNVIKTHEHAGDFKEC